jgi:hypothetical protein
METGDAHKVGVQKVDQKELRVQYIERAAGGGHVFGIDLCGKAVEMVHGIDKILYGLEGAAAVPAEEKAQNAYPEGRKILVNIDPPGDEGDLFVQGMIHRGNGDAARKEGCPVLQKEKVAKN